MAPALTAPANKRRTGVEDDGTYRPTKAAAGQGGPRARATPLGRRLAALRERHARAGGPDARTRKPNL